MIYTESSKLQIVTTNFSVEFIQKKRRLGTREYPTVLELFPLTFLKLGEYILKDIYERAVEQNVDFIMTKILNLPNASLPYPKIFFENNMLELDENTI